MVKTRFLILSDTHNHDDFSAPTISAPPNLPFSTKADVLLHCGDLTMLGGLSEYRSTLKMLSSFDAELKLVIAGNHDRSLDKEFWQKKLHRDRDDEGDYDKAIEMWKGEAAREAGVTYLEEGMYEFQLRSGARFKLYASPYQPEFCGWAFPYEKHEDRFNPANHSLPSATCIARKPIPSFPAVDIVMTHGPPHNHLDRTASKDHVGCPHLLKAIARARPRIHCFGHIHEGYGAELVRWAKDSWGHFDLVDDVKKVEVQKKKMEAEGVAWFDLGEQKFGESTLMVNAAMLDERYDPVHVPWIVDVDLPTA